MARALETVRVALFHKGDSMYYEIIHDRPGRIRFRCGKWLFNEDEANGVVAQLKAVEGVFEVRYREANGGFLVLFEGNARNPSFPKRSARRTQSTARTGAGRRKRRAVRWMKSFAIWS